MDLKKRTQCLVVSELLVFPGDADVAVSMAASPVKRGRPAALFRIFNLMMCEGEVADAAELLLQIVR